MSKSLPLIAGLVGVLSLVLAVVYWLTPAGGLPAFLPGFQAGSSHIHVTHALVLFIVAVVLFALAWFQSGRGDT